MNRQTYTEINQLGVVTGYDVVVIGAGVAGVSAALAAARLGKRVLLVEKTTLPGGLATAGLVAHYLPICDGRGKKVTGGNAERFLHLSTKYGYSTLPNRWDEPGRKPLLRRYQTFFSPAAFVLALEEALVSGGVEVLYDTVFSRPMMEGSRCAGVVLQESNFSRRFYTADAFVDASGDGALFAKAGADMVTGINRPVIWDFAVSLEGCLEASESGDLRHCFELEQRGQGPGGTEESQPYGDDLYRIESAGDLTAFVLDTRRLLKNGIDDFIAVRKAYLAIPSMPNLRKIRRIRGVYSLSPDDVFGHFEDSIGCISDWRTSGPVYEVPFRTLIADGIDNVIAAGRCTAATDDAWEVTRCIPQCVLTGEAAGIVAALGAGSGWPLADGALREAQAALEASGVDLRYA